ncbi:MAG: tetratricopeptide repeat protein [Gemmatimonadota bacterium]
MKSLLQEIHRRSLWQVLAIYLVGGWAVLQVVDTLASVLQLPDWAPSMALFLIIIGLPIVLATAVIQGRSGPSGVEIPAEAASGGTTATAGPPGRDLFSWRNALGGGVAAFALWGVVSAGWILLGDTRGAAADDASGPDLRSIAVLPFVTRAASGDEDAVIFAEGMHDDVLTQLSKIDSLTVISRTSVMQYAGTTKTIRDIATELGVATVLEGGVDRAGSRVRVNVQLIEAVTDRHLWAETYDEEFTAENVFAIRTDLAREIARALKATLSPEVEQRLAERPTDNVDALELANRAHYVFESRGAFGGALDEVESLYLQAIEADPGYAAAYVGLANAYLSAWNWQRLPPEEAQPKARGAVERALEFDPNLAAAHVAHARLLDFELRHDEATRAIQRALELNPGSSDAHALYAQQLQRQGRYEEAVREGRVAVTLDPLSILSRQRLADRLFYTRDYEGSIIESDKVLEMEPGDWYAWYNKGWSLGMLGRDDGAVAAFETALPLADDQEGTVRSGLAWALARADRPAEAREQLEILDAEPSYDIALVWWEMGEAQRAFDVLAQALEDDPRQLQRMLLDPSAEAFTADPGFDAMLQRLGMARED